jgi:uroporphyrinogen decarboxylase
VNDRTARLANPILRIAETHEALRERYPSDVLAFRTSPGTLVPEDDFGEERYDWRVQRDDGVSDEGATAVERAVDLYGVVWERDLRDAAFRPATAPLSGDASVSQVDSFAFPDPYDSRRYAPYVSSTTRASLVEGLGGGLLETAIALRGRSDVLRDLATGGGITIPLLDKIVELKRRYWERRLTDASLCESPPPLVLETERLDVIEGLAMSRREFRDVLLPRWRSVFDVVRAHSPSSAIFVFCDAYRHDILPEWIEAGVSVVNLQATETTEAKPEFLKREYGGSLTFWGGSAREGQSFLQGTPENASDHVKETLDVFAPEGGFIWSFLPIPEIGVAPENIISALDTLMTYGLY